MRTRLLLAAALVAVVALVGACSATLEPSRDGDTPATGDPDAGQPSGAAGADRTLTIVADEVVGPPVQVSAAMPSGGEPLRVAGALFVDADGRVLLCSAIAESFPPQCGGDRLEVIGLDLDTVAGLQDADGVQWAEGVELSGTVD